MANTTFLHHLRDEIDAEITAQEAAAPPPPPPPPPPPGNPTIANVSPVTSDGSSVVIVAGTGFGPAPGSLAIGIFGAASIVSWADTEIKFMPYTAPYNYEGPVAVYPASGGVTYSAQVFHFVMPVAGGGGTGGGGDVLPVITSFAPLTSLAGFGVTITGTGFGAAAGVVMVGTVQTNIVSWSDTKIVFQPFDPGADYSAPLIVKTLAGHEVHSTQAFSFDHVDAGGGGTGGGGQDNGGAGGSAGGTGFVSGGNGSNILVSFNAPTPFATFKTVAGTSLQMTQPVLLRKSEPVFTWNDPNSHSPPATFYGDTLADDMAGIVAGPVPFAAKAPGLLNVEVWLHGKMKARFAPDASGNVSGTIDLTGEKNGPLVWDVYAWNSAPFTNPADGNFRQLKQRVILFVTGGTDYVLPAIPAAASALGLQQRFAEDFVAPLDMSRAGTTSKWYTSKPEPFGEGQFGSAIFVDPANLQGASESPFFQRGGFLRIRYKFDPGATDPFGWGRKWTTGMLATGKPGGVGGFYQPIPYYAECRFLCPIGGVPWPAFWQLTKEGLVNTGVGNVETDTVEFIGLFPENYRAGGIHYLKAGGVEFGLPPGTQPATYPTDAGCFEFHTYGCLVTTTTTTMFLDGVALGSYPTQKVDTIPTRNDFFMINHGGGGGGWEVNWESTLPGTDHYDMWVSDMRVWGL